MSMINQFYFQWARRKELTVLNVEFYFTLYFWPGISDPFQSIPLYNLVLRLYEIYFLIVLNLTLAGTSEWHWNHMKQPFL